MRNQKVQGALQLRSIKLRDYLENKAEDIVLHTRQ